MRTALFTSVETTMGKYRNHRKSRRRRHDDDADSFSEQASEPSYFRRPETIMSDPVDAEVLSFNASKGFGFVKLPNGTEVYLPLRVLEAAGSRRVSEGTHLKVAVEETPRGSQVMQSSRSGIRLRRVRHGSRSRAHLRRWPVPGQKSKAPSNGTIQKGLWLRCSRYR